MNKLRITKHLHKSLVDLEAAPSLQLLFIKAVAIVFASVGHPACHITLSCSGVNHSNSRYQ